MFINSENEKLKNIPSKKHRPECKSTRDNHTQYIQQADLDKAVETKKKIQREPKPRRRIIYAERRLHFICVDLITVVNLLK